MKAFTTLYEKLDMTTSTNAKVLAMVNYFATVPPQDAAWALYFLTGRRLKRLISSRMLREWALEMTGMPKWLYEDAYEAVGDTAETIALLLDGGRTTDEAETILLSEWMMQRILPLQNMTEREQYDAVTRWWKMLDMREMFTLNKLLTGALRVGVSQNLVVRAIAEIAEQPTAVIAHRLMGNWEPTEAFFIQLISPEAEVSDISRPYPFFLASPLEQPLETLGNPADWLVEWKWDGIRSQLIRRGQETHLWSRGEDLVTDRFPEISDHAALLPDGTVLDGEILAFQNEKPLPFAVLQRRIGRKKLTKSILEEAPVAFLAYDLLEFNHEDWREKPLEQRRRQMEQLVHQLGGPFRVSPAVQVQSWEQATVLREESRERNVEGFMLKRLDSTYQAGRKRGTWWKWKIDPYTVDAVLIYAQAGSGRRANLFTDYTFAVIHEGQLVPIAKAYSGLSDKEIQRLDNWIRRHTLDKYGPVRVVEPCHVFELAFEGIAQSSRHKAGLALRFPRILRWREDKTKDEADTLENLHQLLNNHIAIREGA